jgi:spermidine synthase
MIANLDPQGWFTESYPGQGAALSLEIVRKLHAEQSPFQKIEVFETANFGRLLTLDGCTMLTTRENFLYHEMMTHPALFSHPGPEHVLIVGGGDCGCLLEVLKHPGVKQAVQVELDERVTRVCERYFPELCVSNGDPRARLLFEDGIAFVERAPPGSFDVVIIDSTDPVGQAARLFQAEFYSSCRRALGADGILAVQSESPLLHPELIAAIHGEMREAGFAHTASLPFPQFIYPSGWWSATHGSSGPPGAFREHDARNRPFATRYYNAQVHRAAYALPEFLRQALATSRKSD